MQLCKSISWQKEILWLKIEGNPSVQDSDTLSPYVQVVCNGSNGAFSQLGSSDTFCAVISRFVSEWSADVQSRLGGFFSNIVLRTTFLLRLDSGLK